MNKIKEGSRGNRARSLSPSLSQRGNFATNVLIMGKTGVGKSSFINYLYPNAKREIGAGRQVTSKGIHQSTLELDNGLTVNLYDTWGLEADKAEE